MSLVLPGGDQMPTLGLGTSVFGVKPGLTRDAIEFSIDVGYRLFDCAWAYGNEAEVGDAIATKIGDGTVKRENLFVTSKLWCNAHRRGAVENQLRESLRNLKLDYIDLYLIHHPISFKESPERFPQDESGKPIYEYHDITETWKGMEDMVDLGLVRNIGLSNFNSNQVQRILNSAQIKPVVNQIEVHPYFTNIPLVDFCHERGLEVMAYSPFCNPARPRKTAKYPQLFQDPVLRAIAAIKGKTVAQISLRFLLQRGMIVIPKSFTPSRIEENFKVFDFELSKTEMERIYALNENFRVYQYFTEGPFTDHPEYPLNVPF